jgi:hypothetical protein
MSTPGGRLDLSYGEVLNFGIVNVSAPDTLLISDTTRSVSLILALSEKQVPGGAMS